MQIDYVISWVNGQDPQHKARRKFYLAEDKRRAGSRRPPNKKEAQCGFEAITKMHFQDNGELYYNIASVLLYAPFIRRIYIVSDSQTPPLLSSFAAEGKCAADFIRLVSHNEIFAADADFPQLKAVRPSFNSRAIETVLWRIPGLAEHFIFSNDDFFLNAPLTAGHFFREDGAPRLFGRWRKAGRIKLRYFYRLALEALPFYRAPASHGTSLWLGARRAGGGFGGRFFSVPHFPHPLRKSVFAAFFRANPQLLSRQLSFRFRSMRQFNPVSLANHLELERGAKAEKIPDFAYLDTIKSPRDYANFVGAAQTGSGFFGCIQDMGLYPAEIQADLHRILVKKFAAALPEVIKQRLLAGHAAAAQGECGSVK